MSTITTVYLFCFLVWLLTSLFQGFEMHVIYRHLIYQYTRVEVAFAERRITQDRFLKLEDSKLERLHPGNLSVPAFTDFFSKFKNQLKEKIR